MKTALWITGITDELALIGDDDIIEPEMEPTQEGDKPLGELPVELRRLYTYAKSLERELHETRMKLCGNLSDAERALLKKQELQLGSRAELAMQAFLIGVNDEFGLWKEDEEAAIRANWQVVRVTEPGEDEDTSSG